MVGLDKQVIRERLQNKSYWATTTRTALFPAVVPERVMRYVVAIWISGNRQVTESVTFEKLEEDATTYTSILTRVPVAPADFRQIPEGSLNIEDPVMRFEGGTRLYGSVTGISNEIGLLYWDDDI